MVMPAVLVQPIDLSRFSDRHFWHGGYDKAFQESQPLGAAPESVYTPPMRPRSRMIDLSLSLSSSASSAGRSTFISPCWGQCGGPIFFTCDAATLTLKPQ